MEVILVIGIGLVILGIGVSIATCIYNAKHEQENYKE